MAGIGFIEPTATNPATWIRKAAERINYLIRQMPTYALRKTNTRQIAAAHIVEASDQFLAVNAAAAAVTISLPPVEAGRMLWVKKVDASANDVTIDADGTDTIDGAGSLVIDTQYDAFTLLGTEQGWWIV